MSVSELAGRRILITGGASGMGEGLVRSLTGMGALVVSMDLNRERGEAVAKAAGARGFMEVDVADEGSVARAVDAACTGHQGMQTQLVRFTGGDPVQLVRRMPVAATHDLFIPPQAGGTPFKADTAKM